MAVIVGVGVVVLLVVGGVVYMVKVKAATAASNVKMGIPTPVVMQPASATSATTDEKVEVELNEAPANDSKI